MSVQKVRSTFQSNGYPPTALITNNQYHQLLNSLMKGEIFDNQVAEQLWQQAVNGNDPRQVKVDDICNIIVQAQHILEDRLSQINDEIKTLQKEKRNAGSQGRYNPEIKKVEENLEGLYQDRSQYEEDLRLVTQPFGINHLSKRNTYSPITDQRPSYQSIPNQPEDVISPSSDDQNVELKWLLYLTLAFCFIEIIIIYGKYDFLNLIVVTCLLSIYLLNFFDPIYVKLTLTLLIVSTILDLVWLIIYAQPKWHPSAVSNTSTYEVGYQRFIVFFTAVIILIKLPMIFFLFKYRNVSADNNYQLSLGLIKIVLNANKANPISRGINNNMSTIGS